MRNACAGSIHAPQQPLGHVMGRYHHILPPFPAPHSLGSPTLPACPPARPHLPGEDAQGLHDGQQRVRHAPLGRHVLCRVQGAWGPILLWARALNAPEAGLGRPAAGTHCVSQSVSKCTPWPRLAPNSTPQPPFPTHQPHTYIALPPRLTHPYPHRHTHPPPPTRLTRAQHCGVPPAAALGDVVHPERAVQDLEAEEVSVAHVVQVGRRLNQLLRGRITV